MLVAGSITIPVPTAGRRLKAAAVVLLCSCLLLAGGSGSAVALTPAAEYEVKAAFLVNFGGFVRWPAETFADAQSPFTICIIGADPFGVNFEPFKNSRVAGKPLVVRSVTAPVAGSDNCRILFIAGSERPHLAEILRDLRQTAILTVSDLEDFAVDGGMIQLFARQRKIRFEINHSAAEAVGLKIDARLLKLAEPAPRATSKVGR